jgi:zinc resistance-associated protein
MWKTVLAGAAVLTIAGSTVAFTQRLDNRGEGFRRGQPTVEDLQAYADARLAALKAGLSLTEAQAAHWPAFEQAAREWQKLRIDRRKAQAERRNNPAAQAPDPAERLRRRGTAMADSGAALKKLGDAIDPLYKSLDDNQKRRFAALSRIGGSRDSYGGRGDRDDDRRGFRGRDERDFRGDRYWRRGEDRRGPDGTRGRGVEREG